MLDVRSTTVKKALDSSLKSQLSIGKRENRILFRKSILATTWKGQDRDLYTGRVIEARIRNLTYSHSSGVGEK